MCHTISSALLLVPFTPFFLNNYNGIGCYKKINVYSLLLETTGMTYLKFRNNQLYLRSDTGHNAYAFIINMFNTLSEISHEYKNNLNFALGRRKGEYLELESNIFDMKKIDIARNITGDENTSRKILKTMIDIYEGDILVSVERNPKLTQAELDF
jgi:hypothetical protein